MNPKFLNRFVLLDLGHPMSGNTIKNLISSLENVLLLSLTFSMNAKETNFEISQLNSDFVIIHFESNFRRNYNLIAKDLNEFLKKASGRVTVQEFKNLLSGSIEAIFHELQIKSQMEEMFSQEFVEIALISKKSAWVLADILTSTIRKLQKSTLSVKNFKIVQILDTIQHKTEEKNAPIDCIFSLDNPRDLTMFFKGWLLNPKQQLRILISKDANLEMECEVEDCIFSPIVPGSKLDLLSDFRSKRGKPLASTSNQVYKLEIINRVPVNGLCPTLVFGTPRRVKETRWTESQTNSTTFKQLCRELNRTGQGLLAKSAFPTDLNMFYFLTSDGDMILMNNVAPDEFHFPKQEQFSNGEEEHDASILRNCLQKITFLNEFKPENYSSRIYESLRHYLDRTERNKNSKSFEVNLTGKNPTRKNSKKSTEEKESQKEKRKNSDNEFENVHPAFLPPEIVKKYRKIEKRAFKLVELGPKFA